MKRRRTIPELPKRSPESHKGDYGRILIVAGSGGMSGAAALAATAALRGGAGLVTLAAPESIVPVLEGKCTEAIVRPLPETETATVDVTALEIAGKLLAGNDLLLLGPGMGRHPRTDTFLRKFAAACDKPMVLDADGLNAFPVGAHLPERTVPWIVTPHPGEMGRLTGRPTEEIQSDREVAAADFAKRRRCITILKGHRTVVTDGKIAYVNKTGNPGMATAGAGDVLAGLLAALLHRVPALDAAMLAVFLHGRAGDLAAADKGEESLIASDLLDTLPDAFRQHARKQ